jgi:hypothetical protein
MDGANEPAELKVRRVSVPQVWPESGERLA